MLTGLIYTLGWIAIPQLCWRAGRRTGFGSNWRASILFSSTTIALVTLSFYTNGPEFMREPSAFHDTYYFPSDVNYYQTLAILYGVLAFVHIALNYVRGSRFPRLTTLQFWLLHMGTLLPSFSSWAEPASGTSLGELQNTMSLFNQVSLAGILLTAASALLLFITLIGAVWSAPRGPGSK